MATEFVDVEKLLEPVDPARPAGRDCEYDPEFVDLESKSQGQPERRMGDAVQAATLPDWSKVMEIAVALFVQSKDIRVAQYLCRALLGMHGFAGLAEGLEVVHGLLERYWKTLHPQMDPDDRRPALLRVNIINGFADPDLMVRPIRDTILVEKNNIGAVTLRQVAAASGVNRGIDASDPAEVESIFEAAGPEAVRSAATAVQRAHSAVTRIEAFVAAQIDATYTLSLGPLVAVLREASAVLAARLPAASGDPVGGVPVSSDPVPAAGTTVPDGIVSPTARGVGPGTIASSEDVLRIIDRLCEYYAKAEPSSPVPMILKRARRLVGRNFLELLCDLTPDGVGQFETISGVRRDN